MADERTNPIPFNKDLMTVVQLKECADLLSRLFDSLGRGVDHDTIVAHLKQGRDQMAREWSK